MGKITDYVDADLQTINLRNSLNEIRNEAIDLIQQDWKNPQIRKLCNQAEELIDAWRERFIDELSANDDYYTGIAHNIMLPVYLMLDHLEGNTSPESE